MSETGNPPEDYFPELKLPERIETIFDDFLARFEERIHNDSLDRNDVVRDTLYQIYLGAIPDFARLNDFTYPIAARSLLASFDPRNVTLEPEYFSDIDNDLYLPRKPLIWFWYMFDRSPLGLNYYLGMKLRQALAPHIFARVGKDFRCAAQVQFSFGYNLSVGDQVVIGRSTRLDDRGGVDIGTNVIISDLVTIYSHAPGTTGAGSTNKAKTIIGDNVRLGFHSTILPGVHIGSGAVIGPMSVVTRNVAPHHVLASIPAESVHPKREEGHDPPA